MRLIRVDFPDPENPTIELPFFHSQINVMEDIYAIRIVTKPFRHILQIKDRHILFPLSRAGMREHGLQGVHDPVEQEADNPDRQNCDNDLGQ